MKYVFLLKQFVITGGDTISYKFNVGKVGVLKKVCKIAPNLTLIQMLGLNITLTEENVQKAKKFV